MEIKKTTAANDPGISKSLPITTLFLDIGGVLLTDGWDHNARKSAAAKFKLDFTETEKRHQMTFATYEEDALTLKEYLNLTVFYEERPFTPDQFRELMFAQSKPHIEMIELIRKLKAKYELKIIAVSNEARDLNAYRIQKFKLGEFIDAFVSSCFVHIRKPDPEIFRLALDVAQTLPEQIVYIENTEMFVKIASDMGLRGVIHTDHRSTASQLASLGLQLNKRSQW